MADPSFDTSVFINFSFDKYFEPLLQALCSVSFILAFVQDWQRKEKTPEKIESKKLPNSLSHLYIRYMI